MPYQADIEIDLSEHIDSNYIISSQHRRTGNPNKSQWIIDFEDEIQCFINTINNNWKDGFEAWGLKIENASLQVVGVNNNGQLKLAKFVDGTNTNVWHGYPADHMTKAQDRPTTSILKDWVDQGFISKAKMNKIRQGQLCYL
ncbi:hypothetical protein IRZ71_22425 [Flavobacterium sp. ANB]|uniref:hypothetical protein n=1 Tax=unclassified Flavobacterium TaxID=196869 RepID=UPI0012B729FA|nr:MULTISPECIES: hypothetical protein [unclassified Flavobacterium]MBF4519119.1 hypothetical protein [Flavobacterium sp. ANB]MTD71681.1 hypothetical protein [Flavobacterium sp. LC2016-13]